MPISAYRRVALPAAMLLATGIVLAAGKTQAAAPGSGAKPVLLAQSASELPPGMGTAVIEAIQEELNEKGYGAGPVDGISGARTRAAIRSYQRDNDLRITGQPSKELLDHLKFASGSTERQPPVRTTERSEKADSELVKSVQRELQIRGYYNGAIDGIAGANTAAGVRAFQRDAGFEPTGKVDRRLLSELRIADRDIKADR